MKITVTNEMRPYLWQKMTGTHPFQSLAIHFVKSAIYNAFHEDWAKYVYVTVVTSIKYLVAMTIKVLKQFV